MESELVKPLIRQCLFTVASFALYVTMVFWFAGQLMNIHFRCSDSVIVKINRVRFGLVLRDLGFDLGSVDWLDTLWVYGDRAEVNVNPWHALICLLAFNLLLHFVYRKRRETMPCEN